MMAGRVLMIMSALVAVLGGRVLLLEWKCPMHMLSRSKLRVRGRLPWRLGARPDQPPPASEPGDQRRRGAGVSWWRALAERVAITVVTVVGALSVIHILCALAGAST